MRTKIMLAVAALCLGGAAATGGMQAAAQGAPPPPGMDHPEPGMHPPMPGGPEMRGMHRFGGPMHQRGGMMRRMREFALVFPAPDRALSGADVQKIAEAFLLLNGNHTWKVTDVKEEPNRVTFAVATPGGTAIAHFAMDRHTARPERLD